MTPPQLAPGVRRVAGTLLVGGTPLRLLRLSPAGADALDALLGGRAHPGPDVLQRRLVDAGMLLLGRGPARLEDVTVVVPVRGSADEVRRVLAGVPPGVPVVVVDDGSEPPLALPDVEVVRHERSRGPGAARNTGAAHVASELVAFVDAGVALPPGGLALLSGLFADDRVVAAAPRVVSAPAPGAAGVLEQQLCALDQGPAPAHVGPGAPVSYVPSAALVVRRQAFREVGGFDEDLRVGEDVDLVWRLSRLGVVRYDPDVVVVHAPRSRLRDALRRRYDYGTSAGPLDRRHPGELRHLRVSTWSLLPWIAAAVHPAAGVGAAAAAVVLAPGRLRPLPAGEARRIAAGAQWTSFCATGRYLVRPAWPLAVAAATVAPLGRRRARLVAAAYVAGSVTRLRPGPPRDLPARLVLHVADDLAYSLGVWSSALRTRCWRVLLPTGRPREGQRSQRGTACPAAGLGLDRLRAGSES